MKIFMALIALLVLTFNASAEKTGTKSEISCTLTSAKETYKIGEFPRLIFKIKNNSRKDILLVKILDGSDCGFRQPQATLEVYDPDGKLVNFGMARCGNTNILSAKDFVWIKSGAESTLGKHGLGLHSGYFKNPGKYKVKIKYSTVDEDFSKWTGGPMGPEGIEKVKNDCGDLFQKRKKVSLSAEAEITIIGK